MTVARRPKSTKPTEAEIEAVIGKGGGVPGGEPRQGEGSKPFVVRIDSGLFEKMNQAVRDNPVIKSRNTWVVNAIYEQLKRDGLV